MCIPTFPAQWQHKTIPLCHTYPLQQAFKHLVAMDLRQSLSLLLPLLFLSWILRVLFKAYATPLRDIPGPWLAKFTRFWYAKAIGSRNFQKTNLDLHRQYGQTLVARCIDLADSIVQDRSSEFLPMSSVSMIRKLPKSYTDQETNYPRFV